MEDTFREKLIRWCNQSSPFAQHNHISVLDVDDGRAVVAMDLAEDSLNRWGAPHGGALFTLADTAVGVATLTVWRQTCVTLDTRTEYITVAEPAGRLTATATVRHCGGHICFCGSEITDAQGRLIARMEASVYKLGQELPGL